MLRDLLEYVRNPYPWYLAPMGYVRELTGIADRARDLALEWRDHLERSRSIIEESAETCSGRGTVLVVGSGNLLDVPLEMLCRRFGRVVLLDILHSHAVRRAVRGHRNVELITADVTGVAHSVFQAARARYVHTLPKSVPPGLDARTFDLVVSVNLLSQLGVVPCNFLKGHCPAIPPARLSAFTRDLIETHLQWITDRGHRTCLITDVARIETLSSGDVIEKDIVEGVRLPEPDAAWSWQIAPEGRIYRDRAAVHHVQAYRDFHPLNQA